MADDKQKLDALIRFVEDTAMGIACYVTGGVLWGLFLPAGAIMFGFGIVFLVNFALDFRTYLKAKYQ